MIKQIPPSVTGPYDLISTFDGALDWPPDLVREDGESDADFLTRVLRDASSVSPGDTVHVTLSNGELECEVRSTDE